MTKHAPGPWIYQGSMNSRSILIGTPKPEGHCIQYGEAIATVTMNETPEHRGVFDEPAIANARLIAAAPELLDIARNIAGYSRHIHDPVLRQAIEEWQTEARAILTKIDEA